MKRNIVFYVSLIAVILLNGSMPPSVGDSKLQRELAELKQRGMIYRLLDNNLVEVKQEWSGFSRVFSLKEPSEADIRAWAQARGIPILEIDPRTIDTSRFTGWYRYWTQVPLSNGSLQPLIVGDIDRNGRPEAYGTYRDFASRDFETRTYEIDSAGSIGYLYNYGQPRPGLSRFLFDVDRDSLLEVAFWFNGLVSDYEQNVPNALPINWRFSHQVFQGNAAAGFTGIFVGRLDADSLTDFLYQGSEPDSSDTTQGVVKTYVAEYDPQLNNFRRVWSQALFGALGGFAVDDFDLDGRKEFVASDLFGRVYVVENADDNAYQLVMRDSLPFVNVYYQTSGDVDNDGVPEFFVGAVMGDGYWLTMYEAEGNNRYVKKLFIHFLSGDLFPTTLTADVDGDGKLELVVMAGRDLYVLKSQSDNNYYVWYLKREDRKDALALYDFNRDGKMDLIISKSEVNSLGKLRYYSDVYLASSTVYVGEKNSAAIPESFLLRAYPNPFNPQVRIEYELPTRQHVVISIFDVLGNEVANLINGPSESGMNFVLWNANDFASGVYFVRLIAQGKSFTQKLILTR